MELKNEIKKVSFSTLCDIRDELKSSLSYQEKKFMREFNDYQSLKYQFNLYEEEIEKRKNSVDYI